MLRQAKINSQSVNRANIAVFILAEFTFFILARNYDYPEN